MTLLFVYICLALGISFFCSICEAVLLSVTPAFVAHAEHDGRKGARALSRLKANINRPLSAILTLNTVANTAGAALIGAQAAHIFGSRSVGIVSGILTFLILICSEIIPKTLGSLHWRELACPVAVAAQALTWLLRPAVAGTEYLTRTIARGKSQGIFSRAELGAMAKVGADYGDLNVSEYRILSNLLRLRTTKVEQAMTPRTVVFALPEDTCVSDVIKRFPAIPYSRIPVYREHMDETTGFVLKQEIFSYHAQGKGEVKLKDIKRKLRCIPELVSLLSAFESLLANDDHIAQVVDEYGGVEGIISLEDIVENLLGTEIIDETDHVVNLRSVAKQRGHQKMRPGKGAD
ncbi:MAG: hemolysin family protein [Lentisphaeria bacterium]|nr:hemolysin family protein [Lentisphaeria bacterium]